LATAAIVSAMGDATPPTDPQGQSQLAAWLLGEWHVTRAINDDAGRFEGRARFALDPVSPATVVWREHGRLRLGAHDGPAERTLRIARGADHGWEVRFADSRPFHSLDLTTGSDDVTHLCGADTYRGRFEIETPDRFTVTWRITGPSKDDLIETTYERAA
jgi:Family of unknown function (DUF6314)